MNQNGLILFYLMVKKFITHLTLRLMILKGFVLVQKEKTLILEGVFWFSIFVMAFVQAVELMTMHVIGNDENNVGRRVVGEDLT